MKKILWIIPCFGIGYWLGSSFPSPVVAKDLPSTIQLESLQELKANVEKKVGKPPPSLVINEREWKKKQAESEIARAKIEKTIRETRALLSR